jgi:hypothetical protein
VIATVMVLQALEGLSDREAISALRRDIAAGAGGAIELSAHDYERPGKPDCAWDDLEAKQALVTGLVNDALAVLAAVADQDQRAAAGRLRGPPRRRARDRAGD